MKDQDVFQKIGKRMPYEVPDDFFDTISQKTLQKAKVQTKGRGSVRRLIWVFAVAASLVGVIFLAYDAGEKQQSPLSDIQTSEPVKLASTASDSQPENIAMVTEPSVTKVLDTGKVDLKKEERKPSAEPGPENAENLNDLLAGLSDEELMQMVAEIKSDPFMGEAITE